MAGLDPRRRQYLDAMGIEVWVSRVAGAAAVQDSPPQNRQDPPTAEPQSVAIPPGTAPGLNWDALRQRVLNCTACDLHRTRTQAVFGVGDIRSNILVVGEAPGAEEDRQGEPFVGRAGQLLNAMLVAFGRPRETVYIANVLKCRPPNNRDPLPTESVCCRPYLERQIELLSPRLILAVGRVPAQNLLNTDEAVGRLRGKVHRYGPNGIPLVVTYHPSYLLRQPQEKKKSWQDLVLARSVLKSV
ncbi:MAG: uracil-DNA glycosylase [Chromatiales bacterium]|nr:uracil-DNA glycosylase [Chromatiales bacterium]